MTVGAGRWPGGPGSVPQADPRSKVAQGPIPPRSRLQNRGKLRIMLSVSCRWGPPGGGGDRLWGDNVAKVLRMRNTQDP